MANPFVQTIAKNISKQSPLILTGMAVAGLATTVYLGIKATPIAQQKIFDASYDRETEEETPIGPMEMVKLVWKDYAPTAIMGVVTAGCIIGIHSVHSRRSAALMGVYTLTDNAFREYKSQVIEQFGEDSDRKVVEGVAHKRLEANPIDESQVILTGDGEQLCYDMHSGRYFRSDIETIRKAQNDLNQEALQNFYVPLNMFYSLLGLEETLMGDEVGFNSDNLMDLRFTSHLNEKKQACLAIDHGNMPSREYARFH